jgi:hypothetical protein
MSLNSTSHKEPLDLPTCNVSLPPGMHKEDISSFNGYDLLSYYLSWIDTSPITSVLDDLCPSNQIREWKYSPLSLLKLAIMYDVKKVSYRTLVSTLTAEECISIGLEEVSSGQFAIPCSSTVHDFVKNRLSTEGFETIMLTLGKLACKYIQSATGIIDSTPIPASIHDSYAEYNKHYGQKMHKCHIFHYGPFPLTAIFSDGCDYDGHFAPKLADMVLPMDPHLKKLLMDGGYDSFDNHAILWHKFEINPLIAFRETAVPNLEGTEMRINHWVNKLWQKGGDVHASIEEKLKFLCEQGREEQVGGYLRNQNLFNQKFEEESKERGNCERTHAHMKATCNFSVYGIRRESKKLYIIKRFVTYQFILLTNMIRGMTDIHNSSCYI